MEQAALQSARNAGVERALRIVKRLFADFKGNLSVRLWNGDMLAFGSRQPDVTLTFHQPSALRELILSPQPLPLAEAYIRGEISVDGDMFQALALKDYFQSLNLALRDRLALLGEALRLPRVFEREHAPGRSRQWLEAGRRAAAPSSDNSRATIAFHYDVSNDFYRLWLDEEMVYSCAYFKHADDTLAQAQRNKLEHLCRKLRLKPGERLLDIGCGWGALVCWAAKHHGVRAHGVTLSEQQYEYAQKKIRDEGLQDAVTVEIKDYRALDGDASYDKIVSVGMFEHVGLKNLPQYFGTAQRLLKPEGFFMNHGITHDTEGWKPELTSEFINRYVFPDGELDTVSNVLRAMERCGFEILDVEGLRPHYAMTLRHWVRRLEQQRQAALLHVTEDVFRVWKLYMAGSALEFENGSTGIYQILAAKHGSRLTALPLTRRDLYA